MNLDSADSFRFGEQAQEVHDCRKALIHAHKIARNLGINSRGLEAALFELHSINQGLLEADASQITPSTFQHEPVDLNAVISVLLGQSLTQTLLYMRLKEEELRNLYAGVGGYEERFLAAFEFESEEVKYKLLQAVEAIISIDDPYSPLRRLPLYDRFLKFIIQRKTIPKLVSYYELDEIQGRISDLLLAQKYEKSPTTIRISAKPRRRTSPESDHQQSRQNIPRNVHNLVRLSREYSNNASTFTQTPPAEPSKRSSSNSSSSIPQRPMANSSAEDIPELPSTLRTPDMSQPKVRNEKPISRSEQGGSRYGDNRPPVGRLGSQDLADLCRDFSDVLHIPQEKESPVEPESNESPTSRKMDNKPMSSTHQRHDSGAHFVDGDVFAAEEKRGRLNRKPDGASPHSTARNGRARSKSILKSPNNFDEPNRRRSSSKVRFSEEIAPVKRYDSDEPVRPPALQHWATFLPEKFSDPTTILTDPWERSSCTLQSTDPSDISTHFDDAENDCVNSLKCMNAPGDGVLVWIFWNERRSRSRVLFEARNVEGVRRSLKNLADLHIFREGRCLYIKPIQSLSKLPHGTEVPITTNEDDIAILTFEHIEKLIVWQYAIIKLMAEGRPKPRPMPQSVLDEWKCNVKEKVCFTGRIHRTVPHQTISRQFVLENRFDELHIVQDPHSYALWLVVTGLVNNIKVPLWTAFIHNLPQFKYVSVGETVIECHNLTPILFEYREKCVVQEDPSDPVIWIRFNQYQDRRRFSSVLKQAKVDLITSQNRTI